MTPPPHPALSPSPICLVPAKCPGSPWQEWRGHCYRLTYKPVPWHGVRGDCKAFFRSSDAAAVTSQAENDFIKSKSDLVYLLVNESCHEVF